MLSSNANSQATILYQDTAHTSNCVKKGRSSSKCNWKKCIGIMMCPMTLHQCTKSWRDSSKQKKNKKKLNSIYYKPVTSNFLLLISQLSSFMFIRIKYLQNLGCVMGTICVPNYKTSWGNLREQLTVDLLICFSYEMVPEWASRIYW